METYEIFRDLAIIILSAKFMGILAKKCKAPMVVGEIIAGLIVGPCLFDWVVSSDYIAKMAEIGVILIMFSAGLETNLKELKKSGLVSFLIACAGVMVPLAGGAVLYMAFFGWSAWGSEGFFKALFVGSIMTATSVGITVECLREMGYLKGKIGQTILSAAIIDDVIGIIVLTFVIGFKDPSSNPLRVVGNMAAFFAIALIGGYLLYRIMQKVDTRYPHSRRIPIIGLGICFAMAYCAEKYFGIADITGAYVAGIILCNIRDAEYIDRKVSINNYMFFGPIFFVAIGLKTNLRELDTSMLWFSVCFVAVALLTKVIGCGLMSRVCGIRGIDCIKVGAGMMTRGEVALIITQKGLALGIIDSSYFTAVILLIIISSILVPILLKYLYTKAPDPVEPETQGT